MKLNQFEHTAPSTFSLLGLLVLGLMAGMFANVATALSDGVESAFLLLDAAVVGSEHQPTEIALVRDGEEMIHVAAGVFLVEVPAGSYYLSHIDFAEESGRESRFVDGRMWYRSSGGYRGTLAKGPKPWKLSAGKIYFIGQIQFPKGRFGVIKIVRDLEHLAIACQLAPDKLNHLPLVPVAEDSQHDEILDVCSSFQPDS